MAEILDPRQPVRFEPPGQNDAPVIAQLKTEGIDPDSDLGQDRIRASRRVYLLKVPSLYDRIALNRALARRGARKITAATLLNALRRGVERIFGDTETAAKAAVLESIDAFLEAMRAFYRDVTAGAFDVTTAEGRAAFNAAGGALAELEESLAPVANLVAAQDDAYGNLRADAAVYSEVFAIEATRLFLVGWENGPRVGDAAVPFTRDANGVRDEALSALAAGGQLAALGARLHELIEPTETERKNSVSLSGTASGPAALQTSSSAPATTPSPETPSDSRSSTSGESSASTPPTS
jgi:hypothetical protein